MKRFSGILLFGIILAALLVACGDPTENLNPGVTFNPTSTITPASTTSVSSLTSVATTSITVTTPKTTNNPIAATTAAPKPTTLAVNSDKSMLEYDVLPKVTDSAIDNWLEPHYVTFNPAVPAKNKLFLFLVGSFGKPNNVQLISQQAANEGFNAINLRYPNAWTVNDLCDRDSDKACYDKVRLEILDGQDRSDKVTISRANSIENRLQKLLVYLNAQHPEQGWSKFLDGENIRWDLIVVAGHSQGGGHAVMIGHVHQVSRVVMMGAPNDSFRGERDLAPWISSKNATPAANYYGFSHSKDPGYKGQQAAWGVIGLNAFGPVVNVEGKTAPYNNSHQLTTNITPAQPGEFHGSVVVDRNTPKAKDGTPLLKEVWQYLCFS